MDPLRIAATLLRLSLLNEVQYRVNFFVYVFQSLLALGTGLAVIALVFGNVTELNGWSRPELLVVLGVYTLIGGVIRAVIQPSMIQLMLDIQDGAFDFVLVKPVDAQLFTGVRRVQLWQGVDLLTGGIVVAVGVGQLPSGVSVGKVAAFVAMLAIGVVVVYCFWLAMTTTGFWLIRMDQISYLFDGMYQAGRWPIGVYPTWMRVGLTFLVPIAFAVTVPAEALTGRLDWSTVAVALALAVTLSVLTRWFFRYGVRHYSGASA